MAQLQNLEKFNQYCGDCDGCGWVEGGKALKTKCETCKATGFELRTLKELEVGDKFVNVTNLNERFIVRGNPAFACHGSPTRTCQKIGDKYPAGKSCKILVLKIGESEHKEAMKLKPLNIR